MNIEQTKSCWVDWRVGSKGRVRILPAGTRGGDRTVEIESGLRDRICCGEDLGFVLKGVKECRGPDGMMYGRWSERALRGFGRVGLRLWVQIHWMAYMDIKCSGTSEGHDVSSKLFIEKYSKICCRRPSSDWICKTHSRGSQN